MNSPYTPPTTSLIKETSSNADTDAFGNPLPQLLDEPRKCPPGWGAKWWMGAFNIFKENILLWIGMLVTFFIITILAGMVPGLNILASLTGIFFLGGLIKGAASQVEGRGLKFSHLISGFTEHFVPLLIVMLLSVVGAIILTIPVAIVLWILFTVFIGTDASSLQMAMMMGDMSGLIWMILLALPILFIGYLPLIMSVWFAPALIVIKNISATTAMKMSFKASLKNILPFLVYILIAIFILPIFIVITLGLGMFVVYPVSFIIYYVSYRDVLTDQPLSH